MNSNVMTWKSAVEQGFEPRDYPYEAASVGMGESVAKLIFKIWGKPQGTISCFFEAAETGIKFQLTVFRKKNDEVYKLPEGDTDFHCCPTRVDYLIKVRTNEKNRAVFQRADIING